MSKLFFPLRTKGFERFLSANKDADYEIRVMSRREVNRLRLRGVRVYIIGTIDRIIVQKEPVKVKKYAPLVPPQLLVRHGGRFSCCLEGGSDPQGDDGSLHVVSQSVSMDIQTVGGVSFSNALTRKDMVIALIEKTKAEIGEMNCVVDQLTQSIAIQRNALVREKNMMKKKEIELEEYKAKLLAITNAQNEDATSHEKADECPPQNQSLRHRTTRNPKSFNETFTFKREGEDDTIIKNRLSLARTALIEGNYIDCKTGVSQWYRLFKGKTTHEKIKWTGEKGHLKYFFEELKPYITLPKSYRLWETVAAHFTWQYTYKSGKVVAEDFDHRKLGEGKARQTKELDNALFFFKSKINTGNRMDDQDNANLYSDNESLSNSEKIYDVYSNELSNAPHITKSKG